MLKWCSMIPKFLYVFTKEDKETLLSLGYELLKQDEAQSTFVFVNQDQQRFAECNLPHVATNMLYF